MAFVLADLRCKVSTSKNRVFTYNTTDNAAAVGASGYFNLAVADANGTANVVLRNGDQILSLVDTGGTPAQLTSVVTSATGASPVTTA